MADDPMPHGLSIREQQVFQLVREGRLDSEIAVRLGTGAGEVKQTVAVLVSKCGVEDRAALRTWRPREASEPRPSALTRLLDRLGTTASGLLVIAIVVLALVFVVWRALSGDDEATVRRRVAPQRCLCHPRSESAAVPSTPVSSLPPTRHVRAPGASVRGHFTAVW
jgi:DNA-binding CsgD family transcriptional regulator